jgi:small subunit ribosomal protein S27Ae
MMKREIFKIEGDKIIRLRRNCPKCGEGIFLAEHKDRLSCGNCGYTEFKTKKGKKPEGAPKESAEKDIEKPVEEIPEKPIEEEKEESIEKPADDDKISEEKSD